MFDPLLEEDPWVKEKVAQGELRGEAKGELAATRKIFVTVVKGRFPSLAELAERRAAQIEQPEPLQHLINQIILAPGEAATRALLEASAAS